MDRMLSLSQLLFGTFVLTSLMVGSGYTQNEGQFVVKVTEPKQDSPVGREVTVKGTASIPRGHYLWVLARASEFQPLWWPQREAEVNPKTHEWSALAVLGEPQDIGKVFDIGVVTVDAAGHARLKDYWIKAMQSGDWKPIQTPPPSSPPQIIKVRRVRS